MSLLSAATGLLRPRTTMTEDLMRSIATALGAAPQGSLAREALEGARLLASLQKTTIYDLDQPAVLFIDGLSKDLFEYDATVAEIIPEGTRVVVEYPYRPRLKAKKVDHPISAQEEATLPQRMGVLIQRIGKQVYAGLIVDHGQGPKPPPIMAEITDLTCPRSAPFWNKFHTLDNVVASSFAGAGQDQGLLNGFGQDLMEEMAFALAFMALAQSPDTPLIQKGGHLSGFGPVGIRLSSFLVRRHQDYGLVRSFGDNGSAGEIGWRKREKIDIAGQLASLHKQIEECLSEPAPAGETSPGAPE